MENRDLGADVTYDMEEGSFSFRIALSPPVERVIQVHSQMLVGREYQDVAQITLQAQ